MRELTPRREPPALWPTLLLLALGVVIAGGSLWAGLDSASASSERYSVTALLLVVAGELVVTAAIAWALASAPGRLDYRLSGGTLVVSTLLRRRRVSLASVVEAEVLHYQLAVSPGVHLGWPRSHLPGYYVGRWRIDGVGTAQVVVAAPRGDGVVLRFEQGPPLLVAPRNPAALAALLQRRRGAAPGRLRRGS